MTVDTLLLLAYFRAPLMLPDLQILLTHCSEYPIAACATRQQEPLFILSAQAFVPMADEVIFLNSIISSVIFNFIP